MPVAQGGKMAVHFVQNNTPHEVWFRNTEWSGNFRQIPAGQGREVGNAFVPWARSQAEFVGHHFEIIDADVDEIKWFIWQSRKGDGDFIRAEQHDYQDPGSP